MTSAFEITVADRASAADRDQLENRLYDFNRSETGFYDDRDLCCFVRDAAGHLVAGIDGFTWGGYARIDVLWVDEGLRGRGLGRSLLVAAEDEARARGCSTIVLSSHEFQAPGFYEKLGYSTVGRTTETPRGSSELLFQKRLHQDA